MVGNKEENNILIKLFLLYASTLKNAFYWFIEYYVVRCYSMVCHAQECSMVVVGLTDIFLWFWGEGWVICKHKIYNEN